MEIVWTLSNNVRVLPISVVTGVDRQLSGQGSAGGNNAYGQQRPVQVLGNPYGNGSLTKLSEPVGVRPADYRNTWQYGSSKH